ncbi:MAG TPA: hypothetical protein VKW04_18175 [Planctomycetota bacterium]|nr:hypothetical protein [Planctomycetota bacterium]
MVTVQIWRCCDQGCRSTAIGVGSAIGLRGLGWKVVLRDDCVTPETINCPLHFQMADIVSPPERVAAAHSYATFFQECRLRAPMEGASMRRRRRVYSGQD